MKAAAKYLFVVLPLLLLPFAHSARAVETEPVLEESNPVVEEEGVAFSQAELDQMLAPIALYPDSLLSHILMAATYPLEVVEAARWSRANSGLRGEEAVRAVDDRSWDPSVKSLVAFPQILTMMDEKLEWTRNLGDAFLAQQTHVMDTVQGLRQKAYAAGNLQSGEHYRVQRSDANIIVESPHREVIYVPHYDPRVVYGPWWWSAYPPVYWAPWPHHYAHAGFVGFSWGVGVFVGSRFFFGISDWRHRHIKVVHVHHHPHHRTYAHKVWRHNPHHRRGVAYRHPGVHKQFVHGDGNFRGHAGSTPHARREWRGHREVRPGHAPRRFENHGVPPPSGIGRLGMRPDRDLTSRHPNLPSYNQAPARPQAHRPGDTRPPREERARRHESGPRHPQWRANTPQVRVAPNAHRLPPTTARPHQQSRGHASAGSSGRWNQGGASVRGQPAFRGRMPQAGSARAPSASGRSFMRGSSGGMRSSGQARFR